MASTATDQVLPRLTGQARRALVAAFHEARANHDDYVGTEHVLLGLLKESHTGAGALLGLLSVDPERLQKQVRLLLQHSQRRVATERLPLTPGARRTLDWAMQQADEARHAHVGPEHLLFGLCREEDSLAHFLLTEAGVGTEALRAAIHRLPPTENRDVLVQESTRIGALGRADPSLDELKKILDETSVTGPELQPAAVERPMPLASEIVGVRRQLASTQFLLAFFVGAMVGVTLGAWYMALCMIAGAIIGSLRSSWLGSIAGAWAGIALAHHLCPGRPIEALLLILAAILAGVAVGDWPARLLAGFRNNESSDDAEL